mgnify:CR=1 FL=1
MEMLAAKMRDLGHKWTKITVHNIETGDRQLRMKEAVDVPVINVKEELA